VLGGGRGPRRDDRRAAAGRGWRRAPERARAAGRDRRGRPHPRHRATIGIDDIALRRPTLDDVFLQLTGRTAEASEAEDEEAAA
jgi:hypothetical protein